MIDLIQCACLITLAVCFVIVLNPRFGEQKMKLSNIQSRETFAFSNLGELRDWLNMFETTDLSTVLPDNARGHIRLDWIEEVLSDGSIVNNVDIS